MSHFRVSLHIVPRKGVLDPQGKAVTDALHSLGFIAVDSVRVGRHLEIDVEAVTPSAASDHVATMCKKLLANPVTEDYEVAGVKPV